MNYIELQPEEQLKRAQRFFERYKNSDQEEDVIDNFITTCLYLHHLAYDYIISDKSNVNRESDYKHLHLTRKISNGYKHPKGNTLFSNGKRLFQKDIQIGNPNDKECKIHIDELKEDGICFIEECFKEIEKLKSTQLI